MAWGLAFHSLLIAVLFGLIGLPEHTVRTIAAWKEIAVVVLLAAVVLRSFLGRGPHVRVASVDLFVAALIGTALIYLVGENVWLDARLPLNVELLGFRQTVFFLLMYFLGRATPELGADDRAFKALFGLLLVTCILGILERFFLPPQGLVALGVASYFQTFLGLSAMTTGNEYGLPTNYWSGIAGIPVRRAGSVYLGGQAFAIPFLLLFPLATAWVLGTNRRSMWRILGYAAVCFGLLLTLTRMTITVAIIQLLLFLFLKRKPEWGVGVVVLFGLAFVAALLVVPGLGSFLLQTLSGQESSAASHVTDWSNGLAAFAERPWGYGLGTADEVSTRAGLHHITGDNLYLSYAVQLGLAGLLLLWLILGTIAGSAMSLVRHARSGSEWRAGMTVFLATIGLVLNGMTAVVFNSLMLGWMFFWLAGAVVTLAQRAKASSSLGAAAS